MYLPLYALLAFILAVVKTSDLEDRQNPCDPDDGWAVFDDGPTSDATAGVGAEFESPGFVFKNAGCSQENTDATRKLVVGRRTGHNWQLTADSASQAGELYAEYILDGRSIKVGSGDLAQAGADFVTDLNAWVPWKRASAPPPYETVTIEGSQCNPWQIEQPAWNAEVDSLPWGAQVTAPMPLEAMYNLLNNYMDNSAEKNILSDSIYSYKPTLVTKKFFQSNPSGINGDQVTQDVLGFCSLVLSYAKLAKTEGGLIPRSSPKKFMPFMPRTEFNTMYQQVKSKLPEDLFSLFNILACYKNKPGQPTAIALDKVFCSGTLANPQPSGTIFGDAAWELPSQPPVTLNNRDWIQGIGKQDPSPDLLTAFDSNIDGSIGGLGTATEKMFNSQRSVPLFEFRDLDPGLTSNIATWLGNVDQAIQLLHNTYATPLQKRKRQVSGSCTPPGSPPVGSGPCIAVGGRFDSQVMRILPLGASIVWGLQSFSGNGFRQYLRQKLVDNGATVNMVGRPKHGPMGDNDVEGWPGRRIDEVANYSKEAIPFQPNIVLLNAGTNDVYQDYFLDSAADRLGYLIGNLTNSIPGTVVLASTVLPTLNATRENRTVTLNGHITSKIQNLTNSGQLVYLVDMHAGMTPNMINVRDGIHPTDYGYERMAELWYSGIQQVFADCWVTAPTAVAGVNDSDTAGIPRVCDIEPKNLPAPVKLQKGSGLNDTNYFHVGDPHYVQFYYGDPSDYQRATPAPDLDVGKFSWADIDGDGIDEFLWYDSSQNLNMVPNGSNGFGAFKNSSTLTVPGFSCNGQSLFLDFDGDGRADALCVSSDGTLSAWQNTVGGSRYAPNWVSHGVIKSASGYSSGNVRIADIDGDGKLDYLGINSDGSVRAWRSIAPTSFVPQWQDIGVVYSQSVAGAGGTDGVRFIDVNGDGRADWIWVGSAGQIYTSINQRGSDVGYKPVWLPAKQTSTGTDSGVTNQDQIQFGKIFFHDEIYTYPNYTARGLDYSIASKGKVEGSDPCYNCRFDNGPCPPSCIDSNGNIVAHDTRDYYPLILQRNDGGGGARPKADSVRYCDMRGSGSDDLIGVEKDGTLKFHGNGHGLPAWQTYKGFIYEPGQGLMGNGVTRKDVHLADLDGDGKCDFLIVNKNTSSIHMVQNGYVPESDTFGWKDLGTVSGGFNCPQKYGPGEFDLAVRFADLDGDGKADVLCITPDGSITGALNKGLNAFQDIGLIRGPQGVERANIRFADLNGDGRADLIVLNAGDGTVTAWKNGGLSSGGEAINWQSQGVVVNGGITRGECVNFANLNGYGRSDIIYLYPNLANAEVIYNVCPL